MGVLFFPAFLGIFQGIVFVTSRFDWDRHDDNFSIGMQAVGAVSSAILVYYGYFSDSYIMIVALIAQVIMLVMTIASRFNPQKSFSHFTEDGKMICSKCGNEIPDGAKYCPKCGKRAK